MSKSLLQCWKCWQCSGFIISHSRIEREKCYLAASKLRVMELLFSSTTSSNICSLLVRLATCQYGKTHLTPSSFGLPSAYFSMHFVTIATGRSISQIKRLLMNTFATIAMIAKLKPLVLKLQVLSWTSIHNCWKTKAIETSCACSTHETCPDKLKYFWLFIQDFNELFQ